VGSTPTRSIFITLVKYGIVLRSLLTIVGQKAMTENQGDNKGFFTKDDFIYILLMLPNQHWTIDQTEQTLCVFVEESELQEIEPGRYKPNPP
jgi:hypothetical protein